MFLKHVLGTRPEGRDNRKGGTASLRLCGRFLRIDGYELDLAIGVTSILSSNPFSLAAQLTNDGTYSKDELPMASPTGI